MEATKKIPALRFPDFEGEWEEKEFLDVFDSISTKKFQIKTSENKEFGLYEVVDQGQSPISGYSDESSKLFKQTPVILYGDHTTIVKFRTTPFIVGADGVKLLKETSQKNDLKFLYHCLCFNNVNPEGYKRHFSILKTKSLNIAPSLPEQQKIADCLTAMDDTIEAQQQKVEQLKAYKKGLLQQLFSQTLRFSEFEGEWEEKKLGKVCKITTGKLDANAMVEGGAYHFFTCAKECFKIDKYAFDTEALLISGNGANVGYIHYFNGKFNAYQRTYVLDSFQENIFYVKFFLEKYLPYRISREKNDGATPYIVLNTLYGMNIKYPNSFEQQKIADCLSTLDEVIELEQQKLEKLQVYKKGLLQQLFV